MSYTEKQHYKAELQVDKENKIHLLIIRNLCKQCLNQAAQCGLKFHARFIFRETAGLEFPWTVFWLFILLVRSPGSLITNNVGYILQT